MGKKDLFALSSVSCKEGNKRGDMGLIPVSLTEQKQREREGVVLQGVLGDQREGWNGDVTSVTLLQATMATPVRK